MATKQPSTCPQCTLGWMETIILRGTQWRKCRSCGFMERVSARTIKPIGDK